MMQTEDEMLTERLTVDPEILGGKPIIKGTRITVEFILELLGSGVSEEEILHDYPHLTREDLQACLSYAAHALRNEIYLDLRKAS
jgi:uncharacterized protein (DUF433 family)